MPTLGDYLDRGLNIESLLAALAGGAKYFLASGPAGSQKSALAARLAAGGARIVVLTAGEETARAWTEDLRALLPEREIFRFPAREWPKYDVLSQSRETADERLRALALLAAETAPALAPVPVLTAEAVSRRWPLPAAWRRQTLILRTGEVYPRAKLLQYLTEAGYTRENVAAGPGQFALRGGILDVAPPGGAPLRLEFFDEELDAIRPLDLDSQLSAGTQSSARLTPAREFRLSPEEQRDLTGAARRAAAGAAERLRRAGLTEAAARVAGQAGESAAPPREFYPLLALRPALTAPFWEWLPPGALLLLDEPQRLREQLEFALSSRLREYTASLERGEEFVPPDKLLVGFEAILAAPDCKFMGLCALPHEIPGFQPERHLRVESRSVAAYAGQALLVKETADFTRRGYAAALCVGDAQRRERLLDGLTAAAIPARRLTAADSLRPGETGVYPFSLEQGFELPGAKLILLTETEIYQSRRRSRPAAARREAALSLPDLKPGDFVTHIHHGVGRFVGIETITAEGIEKDFFAIRYAGEDKLYVPLDHLGCLEKYMAGDGEREPKLNKLNGSGWQRAKTRARAAVREMAIDLVALYAEREKEAGFAFGEDTEWQREFEEKFPYEETQDQLQSIREIKRDMRRRRPMDRLLCGDVGYGKTEVALRAAFKVVEAGKQAAILVPTTILAQQHFNTMRERFADYPVRIESLSRFCPAERQREIARGLRSGAVDLVVGTHKLLSDGIAFKDLGLLVIDEEHRFGVAHKEKIKQMKRSVDVLTLTATPIPRTLHMSLAGIRDISVINTPPEDRQPVLTYVAEFSPNLVRDAIRREIGRGGQVFYVHNRVQSLERVERFLRELAPEARYGLVHGQMPEALLEKEMLAFLRREKDVMICTAIIETGLDMPNVNTLIVDDADRFGLSQLYQLRGRVGRSSRRAYAYFLYQPRKVLTESAEKRLTTIREFTEFGSGLKIAMRDLEIRGAGNLIGGEQHGHMAAVGFGLYTKMLREAVRELKGEEEPEPPLETVIDLKMKALLPDSYVGDRRVKAVLYQRMAAAAVEEDVSDIIAEMIDRFGEMPPEADNLVRIMELRVRARALGIREISRRGGRLTAVFARDPGISGEELMQLAQNPELPLAFQAADGDALRVSLTLPDPAQTLKTARALLRLFETAAAKSDT
ncbi:MAG: transcription-repair coupling factor [Gracilibacteraceae bacterium]|jgi:transcription-repair coupling factor (superfamily II helicase)|nr:transcription-repair coupling factor [Gracilibacteraceae bacterium]